MIGLKQKDKRLGVADKKRQYDLPLDKDEGTDFLILLVGLMMFLATCALTASFALGTMSERWSSGLENKATVEIPAETTNGNLRTAEKIKRLSHQAQEFLNDFQGVKSAEIMDEEDIQALISPWLGDGVALEGIPLPGLIALEFEEGVEIKLQNLKNELANIEEDIRLDTHESWLNDILRFTGALQLSAAMIVLIISATTVISIAGAIRARIAVHKADVELLHLMGASDDYISRQFVRHALSLSFKGAISGVALGGLAVFIISLVSGNDEAGLIPGFALSNLQITALIALPFIACVIGGLTARHTVLRSLSEMP